MSRTTTPQPFSDSFWPNSSKHFSNSNPFHKKKSEEEQTLNKFLSIDESPEFYDPYSDLNLFLSKKIKKEWRDCGTFRKWSPQIQEKLLEKISPEFQERFPQYRLGITALKKIWEKAAYYWHQFEGKEDAFTPEGKINIHFLIRENLKGYTYTKHFLSLHPSHFSHQLARKLNECIAVMDGEKVKLDALTKLAWSAQRHLIPYRELSQLPQSSYDAYDATDQFIIRAMVKILAQETLGYKELKAALLKELQNPKELEEKIEKWALQSDMIYAKVHIDPKDPLLQLICSMEIASSHQSFVDEVSKHYPEIDDTLHTRIWIVYKHAWYTHFCSPEETLFDRFLKWHEKENVQAIVEKALPLMSFRLEEKKNPPQNKRDAQILAHGQ